MALPGCGSCVMLGVSCASHRSTTCGHVSSKAVVGGEWVPSGVAVYVELDLPMVSSDVEALGSHMLYGITAGITLRT